MKSGKRRLAYLGPPGSYSHEAALAGNAYYQLACEPVPVADFNELLRGVENGLFAYALLPVENSTQGAVTNAMDGLLQLAASSVCGEITWSIDHCLLGQATEETLAVYSHEQALGQCRAFLEQAYPQAELVACASTSQACALAKQKGEGHLAIAGRQAARLYELPVLQADIQDNRYNQTRFLLLGHRPKPVRGQAKTSIAFSFAGDGPGNLCRVLQEFAARAINLTRIESRPAKHLLGQYIFYIDFLAHRQEPAGAAVLTAIAALVSRLQVFGSYPLGPDEAWLCSYNKVARRR